ncbi:MAG: transposase [Sodalis sp. (in: enterobacteria)]
MITETCEKIDFVLLDFSGKDDHFYMMILVHSKIAISNLVSKLKRK